MEIRDLEQQELTLNINGEKVTLAEATVACLRDALRAKGVVTFAALVDGAEVSDPDSVVAGIEEGATVEIRTYAKPGHLA